MEENFRKFQELLPLKTFSKGKGKGRGKTSQKDSQFSEEVAKEAQKRLRSFLQGQASTSSATDSFPLPSAPPMEAGYWTEDNSSVGVPHSLSSVPPSISQRIGATSKVYITNIEVTLNGTPIDQVCDKQNEEECMQAYWRLFTFNGQMNSLFTNGIRN